MTTPRHASPTSLHYTPNHSTLLQSTPPYAIHTLGHITSFSLYPPNLFFLRLFLHLIPSLLLFTFPIRTPPLPLRPLTPSHLMTAPPFPLPQSCITPTPSSQSSPPTLPLFPHATSVSPNPLHHLLPPLCCIYPFLFPSPHRSTLAKFPHYHLSPFLFLIQRYHP